MAERPLDRNVMPRRDRNACSRYDYPDDRKEFRRWVKLPGPCSRPYWHWDETHRFLYLELGKGLQRYQYRLDDLVLHSTHLGWRSVVAHALREVRNALRHNVQLNGAPLAVRPSDRRERF